MTPRKSTFPLQKYQKTKIFAKSKNTLKKTKNNQTTCISVVLYGLFDRPTLRLSSVFYQKLHHFKARQRPTATSLSVTTRKFVPSRPLLLDTATNTNTKPNQAAFFTSPHLRHYLNSLISPTYKKLGYIEKTPFPLPKTTKKQNFSSSPKNTSKNENTLNKPYICIFLCSFCSSYSQRLIFFLSKVIPL